MNTDPANGRVPSPEMELLCACLCPGGAADAPGAGAAPSVDWSRFRALATHHHVIPLAYQALKTIARRRADVVPREFLACLRHDYLAIAAHNFRATAVLCRLQSGAEAQGVRLVPIKGPALAVLAYGDTSLRQFEDLDLLVPGKDLLRAVEWFEREGYVAREIPATADRLRYLASRQDWSLQKPGEALHLDLKPALISHTLADERMADHMVAACRPLAMDAGRSLRAPGPEAMLLAVCMDGANEMWAKLSSIADVGALLANAVGADWAGLLRDAGRFGQKRSLLTGVWVAEQVLGGPVPDVFRREAAGDAVLRRLANEAAGRVRAGRSLQTGIVRRSWFAFRTRDRFCDRARFLSRLLFVPGAADLDQFALPDAAYPLYSCLRPFRLVWDAVRGGSRRIRVSGTGEAP